DAVLLDEVRGRIALGGARPPRPSSIGERNAERAQRILEPVPNRPPRAHVLRLLLRPDDLSQRRIGADETRVRVNREGIKLLESRDRDVRGVRALLVADEVVVELARADDEPSGFATRDRRVVDYRLKGAVRQVGK